MQWLRGFVTGLSYREPSFSTKRVHVRLVMENWHWDRLFSEHFVVLLYHSQVTHTLHGYTVHQQC